MDRQSLVSLLFGKTKNAIWKTIHAFFFSKSCVKIPRVAGSKLSRKVASSDPAPPSVRAPNIRLEPPDGALSQKHYTIAWNHPSDIPQPSKIQSEVWIHFSTKKVINNRKHAKKIIVVGVIRLSLGGNLWSLSWSFISYSDENDTWLFPIIANGVKSPVSSIGQSIWETQLSPTWMFCCFDSPMTPFGCGSPNDLGRSHFVRSFGGGLHQGLCIRNSRSFGALWFPCICNVGVDSMFLIPRWDHYMLSIRKILNEGIISCNINILGIQYTYYVIYNYTAGLIGSQAKTCVCRRTKTKMLFRCSKVLILPHEDLYFPTGKPTFFNESGWDFLCQKNYVFSSTEFIAWFQDAGRRIEFELCSKVQERP